MSSEIINTAVLIPNPPNWAAKPKWSRKWQTVITGGVTGAEDRAALRSTPLVSLEYSLLAELGGREALTGRLQTALKSGRACVPRWDRPQYLSAEAGGNQAYTDSLWPWRPGEYAIFIHRQSSLMNRYLGINCGGGAVGSWSADLDFSGGSPVTTGESIDRSAVDYPAPEGVYQSLREVVGSNEFGVLTYTLDGWEPGVPCHVRLHFAELADEHARQMDILVRGETLHQTAAYEPLLVAGELFKAAQLVYRLLPGPAGRLVIRLEGRVGYQPDPPFGPLLWPCGINGIEVIQLAYEVRQLTAGTEQGYLVWTDRLLGQYPAGSAVYPLLFGKPTLGDMSCLTNYLADVGLKVEEPLGDGDVAAPGVCPVETPRHRQVIWVEGGGQPPWPGTPVGTVGVFPSRYLWAYLGNPNVYLTQEQIDWSVAMLFAELPNHPEITGKLGPLFWLFEESSQTNQYTAAAKFPELGPEDDDPKFTVGPHYSIAMLYDPGDTSEEPSPTDGLTASYGYCQP